MHLSAGLDIPTYDSAEDVKKAKASFEPLFQQVDELAASSAKRIKEIESELAAIKKEKVPQFIFNHLATNQETVSNQLPLNLTPAAASSYHDVLAQGGWDLIKIVAHESQSTSNRQTRELLVSDVFVQSQASFSSGGTVEDYNPRRAGQESRDRQAD